MVKLAKSSPVKKCVLPVRQIYVNWFGTDFSKLFWGSQEN